MPGEGRGCVAGWNEAVSDSGEDEYEALQVLPGSKSLHQLLPFPDRQMGVLRPVVQPLVGAVLGRRHDVLLRRAVGAELVGDDALRADALLLQQALQKLGSGVLVTLFLYDLVEDVAILIDRAPQPAFLTRNVDHHFVEMPDIVATWGFALQAAGEVGAEFHRPSPDRLVREHDPALRQHLLDQAQAQRETEVEPDRMGDDLWWKTVALIADGLIDHAAR